MFDGQQILFGMIRKKFPVQEKLKGKKNIDSLFLHGTGVLQFPIRLIYLRNQDSEHHLAGFGVSKKRFKLAVDRNRIKRQMREAYRLNKHLLQTKSHLNLMFIYVHSKKVDYIKIDASMKVLIDVLNQQKSLLE